MNDRVLIVLASMLATMAGIGLFALGWSYDHIGFGLNPMVSYPLGTLFLAAPIAASWEAKR